MIEDISSAAYKSILCGHFLKGLCDLGANCSFAHGNRELRSFENPLYKAQLCTAYEQGGVCQMGNDCLFAHGEDEVRSDDIKMATGVAAESPKLEKEKRGGFKSALCMHFAKHGSCHMGTKCTFAHGKEDLVNVKAPDSNDPKYKTKLCLRFAQDNFCPSGDFCVFAHGEAELKSVTEETTIKRSPLYKSTLCHNFSTLGVCPSGRNCSFAHGRFELRPAGFDGDFEAKIQENPRWKCSLCKNFAQTGHCSKGNCDFAHGEQELRTEMADNPRILRSNYKTVMCNNWATNGYCFHEETCTFAHGDDELQKFSNGKDVATALKLIRGGGTNNGIRKRPTTAMSQTSLTNGAPNPSPIGSSIQGQNMHAGGASNDQKLFAEFLEFKKFKEQSESAASYNNNKNSGYGMGGGGGGGGICRQESQNQTNRLLLNPSAGYEPIKVLHSATGRQVAVTELMAASRAGAPGGRLNSAGGGGGGNGGRNMTGMRGSRMGGLQNMPPSAGMNEVYGSGHGQGQAQQEMDYSY